MRVLVVIDALDLATQPVLADSNPRHDLELLPRLDSARIQTQVVALKDLGVPEALAWRRLRKLIREQSIELIHVLTPRAVPHAAIAARLTDVPALESIHTVPDLPKYGLDALPKLISSRTVQLIRRWGIDRVVVPAEFIRKSLWRIRYPRSQVEILYPGVALRSADAPPIDRQALGLPAGPLVTMVAPLVENQGYNTLLDMVPRLQGRVPHVTVVAVGSGPLLLKLRQRSGVLPILWMGEHSDVRDIIAASDVIMVHPRFDSLPRVVFEAAAAAKPIVSSRVGGITEIIEHGTNGLLVTYDDSRDLAVQLSRLLLQPAFRHDVGLVAQRRARDLYSVEARTEALMVLYESTIYASR